LFARFTLLSRYTLAVINLSTVFPGESQMARRMRNFDWSATPLGAPEAWSRNLRTSVRIILTSRHPMFVWWGGQLINLYNDDYGDFLHRKHPWALGRPAAEVWPEVWDQVRPRVEFARRRDAGTYDEALPFVMHRKGYPEETYVTFSYSPVPDDDGAFGGILCPVTEETRRIVGERQLALLRELAVRTARARAPMEACTLAAHALATNRADLPFTLIYLLDDKPGTATLVGHSGVPAGDPVAPARIDTEHPSIWPIADVVGARRSRVVSDLSAIADRLPVAHGSFRPNRAVIMPLLMAEQPSQLRGVLIMGLSPLRRYDDNYERFLGLVAGAISGAISTSHAYDAERQRAEALASLDRAKTEFFSNVSHEFRTPLTLMLGPLEEELRLGPRGNERMRVVYRNARRLLKLVNTLSDFSRTEKGRLAATYEPTDLSTFTAELASVFRSAIETAGLSLDIDCEPLAKAIYVDRDMWETIVLNLMSNAFKFTFSGGIKVSLQACGPQVVLSVRDSGVGIAPSEIHQIFNRFHRGPNKRSRTHEGAGIGLALVRQLVELHGGTIVAESVEGRGTTFTASLPSGIAHLPADRVVHAHRPLALAQPAAVFAEDAALWLRNDVKDAIIDQAPPSLGRERVLVADDNADLRDYVAQLMAREYEVVLVANGRAALAAVQRARPDLVLADVMMPELDGFGLAQHLRLDPATADIPIVLLSAQAGEESRVEGLERGGVDDYLVKPFSARELLARVRTHLKLASSRRAVREALARSNAELERRVAERTSALQEREQQLAGQVVAVETLQSISTRLISESTRDGFYTQLLDATMELMHADAASLQALAPGGEWLSLIGSRNFHPTSRAYWQRVDAGTASACGMALKHNERVLITDVEQDAFVQGSQDAEEYRRSGLRAVQSTPLRSRTGRPLGMLSTLWRAPHTPTEHDFRLFDVLARQAADLMERTLGEEALRAAQAELEERVRVRTLELAEAKVSLQALFKRMVNVQEDERSRIARDVHDLLGQPVTALRMNLELLHASAVRDPRTAERAARTLKIADELDRTIDMLARDLRPASLDEFGLAAGLAHLVRVWSERFDIAADYDAVGAQGLRLPIEVESHLYRIAQEALHNVAKHAEASRVSVLLECGVSGVRLVVEDNGRGFEPGRILGKEATAIGLGLMGMRERAALVGAEVDVESAPRRGTTVFVRVPVARPD
jgi:signal transduction histidine kinase/DNA-binding response OmpR family regulator